MGEYETNKWINKYATLSLKHKQLQADLVVAKEKYQKSCGVRADLRCDIGELETENRQLKDKIKLRSKSEKLWIENYSRLKKKTEVETTAAYNRGYIKGLQENR